MLKPLDINLLKYKLNDYYTLMPDSAAQHLEGSMV